MYGNVIILCGSVRFYILFGTRCYHSVWELFIFSRCYLFVTYLKISFTVSILFQTSPGEPRIVKQALKLSGIFPFSLSLLFSQLFVKPPQTITLPSRNSFSLGWFWSLPPVQCYEPLSIVLQALYLPDLIPWIYLLPPLYNHEGFDLGHTWIA